MSRVVYIRFGRWSARSMDHSTHVQLRGVSVHRAYLDLEYNMASLIDEPSEQLDGQGRLVFVVTGKCVGYGPDGEPLLRGVREARRIAIDIESIPKRVKI